MASELTITPDYERKTAKVKGVVACGEHVAVRIANAAQYQTDSLRLRVCFNGHTIAKFPLADEDAWEADGEDLTCTLNTNTIQAMRLCCAPEQECLFVLEDVNSALLLCVSEHDMMGWPHGRGNDEIVNLDGTVARLGELAAAVTDIQESMGVKVSKGSFEVFSEIATPKATLSSLRASVGLIISALKGLAE